MKNDDNSAGLTARILMCIKSWIWSNASGLLKYQMCDFFKTYLNDQFWMGSFKCNVLKKVFIYVCKKTVEQMYKVQGKQVSQQSTRTL